MINYIFTLHKTVKCKIVTTHVIIIVVIVIIVDNKLKINLKTSSTLEDYDLDYLEDIKKSYDCP